MVQGYTTGQVGRMLNVAASVVARWVDRGVLKGARMPHNQQRLIDPAGLVVFIREHGFPMPPQLYVEQPPQTIGE